MYIENLYTMPYFWVHIKCSLHFHFISNTILYISCLWPLYMYTDIVDDDAAAGGTASVEMMMLYIRVTTVWVKVFDV